MKQRASADELYKKLTFGIKKTKVEQRKGDSTAGHSSSRIRVLPDNYEIDYCRNIKGTHKQECSSSLVCTKEPEILKGITTSKIKKKRKNMALKKEQVARLRKLNHIFIWGADIPDPLIHFSEINLSQLLINNLKEFDITEPTPIQMQAIPVMMQSRDLLCSAPTGSGKTLAYALPIIVDIVHRNSKLQENRSSFLNAVVLEPTRELAKQVYVQFLKFSQNLPVTCDFLESDEISRNSNVVITTPNRLIYALKKNRNALASNELKWLVIDESDRLFDTTEGDERCFRSQLSRIYQACSGSSVRHAFFSATFSYEVEDWCKKNLHDVAVICIGTRNSAVDTVRQELVFAGSEHGKIVALRMLFQNGFEPPALVFVQSKSRARQLVSVIGLLQPPVPVALISSERTETERELSIAKFRSGQIWVLVCTDLMGRGLDLSGVNLVINFDLPTSIISYIHRIGRTGRAGRHGHAITYFTEDDLNFIRPIATVIKQAGFDVPNYTLRMQKLTREQKKKLLRRAPKRKDIAIKQTDEKQRKRKKSE